MLNHKKSQTYLVIFASIFLFLVGVSSSSAATIFDVETSKKLSNSLNKNSVVFVLMSREANNVSDVKLVMKKPILPPPSVESYGNWRDMDWKDPFARNGSVHRLDRKIAKKSEPSISLELSMPVAPNDELIDDLRDPFAPNVTAPEMSDPFEGYNRFMFAFNHGFYDSVMEPVVRGYRDAVSEDIRMVISNVFDNAMAPL